jgi:hypothetical protein
LCLFFSCRARLFRGIAPAFLHASPQNGIVQSAVRPRVEPCNTQYSRPDRGGGGRKYFFINVPFLASPAAHLTLARLNNINHFPLKPGFFSVKGVYVEVYGFNAL